MENFWEARAVGKYILEKRFHCVTIKKKKGKFQRFFFSKQNKTNNRHGARQM